MLLHHVDTWKSQRFRSRTALAVVLTITALGSAACGSESTAAEDIPIDLGKLDTGRYQTNPQALVAKDPKRMARQMEALRLGNIMPLAQEIDPALTFGAGGVHPFVDVESFDGEHAFGRLNTDSFVADTPGFIAGFATSGKSNSDDTISYSLTDAVMIFESDDAATAGAAALARSGFHLQPGDKVETSDSARYPSAHVSWMPQYQALTSWYATGKFVIITVVQNQENVMLDVSDRPGLLALSDKAIAVTVDRLKEFQPTPPEKVSDLDTDPERMLRLTLLRPPGDQTAFSFDGTLDSRGALHTSGEPTKARELYEKAGVDFISYSAGRLVRARDAAAAAMYLTESYPDRYRHRIEPPPGLPVAVCTQYQGPNKKGFTYRCYVTHGRYAAEVWSLQQQDAYQRISAQYAMLANDK